MNDFGSNQEKFWAGEFGNEYSDRNVGNKVISGNISLFSKIFLSTENVRSVIEFGSNIGLNLVAIKTLIQNMEMSAIEINSHAVDDMKKLLEDKVNIYHQSILDFEPDYPRDLAFTKGVLIHINPDLLDKVYDLLYRSSKRYICVTEYYNPSPVTINYRGNTDVLFKRDFASEMLDKYDDLRLLDYVFS